MPRFSNLLTSLDHGILSVIINRESKLNALDTDTLKELAAVMQRIYHSADIRGCIITGSGSKAFAAGADISEIASLDRDSAEKFAEYGQRIFRLIEECPKPVIAAVNGFALGGGCELAMACHLRVAVTSAKFGQPEVNLGIIPGYGGTQRLTRLVGRTRALELMMSGDIFSASEAQAYGLINHLCQTTEEMMAKCHELLKKILAKAPLAIAGIISSVNAATDPQQDGYRVEIKNFRNCCSTEDFKEGTTAFLEKRSPKFRGK